MKKQFIKALLLALIVGFFGACHAQNVCGTLIGSGSSVNNLANGSYAVVVTNAQGCTTTTYADVITENNLIVTLTARNNNCAQTNSGELAATATGGAGYSYLWSTGGTGSSIVGLSNGIYSVTVTGSGGCTASASATVGTDNFTVIATAGNNHCNMIDMGGVSVDVSGQFYSFEWSNGSTDESISNLANGTYAVTVTDLMRNCSATASATVAQDNVFRGGPVTPLVHHNHCMQTTSGEINANPDNIILWTAFAWSNGNTDALISGLTNGTYTVTVTDYAGCTASISTTIVTDGGSLVVEPIVINNHCAATNSGQIQANAMGSFGYTYTWSDGSHAANLAGLTNGTYTLTVTDYAGCSATASSVVVSDNPLTVNMLVTDNYCAPGNSGQISAQASGASSYTYAWSNGNSGSSVSNLANGNYVVTVVGNSPACTVTASATVNTANNLQVSATVTNNCTQNSLGSITANPTGGSGFSYQWYSVTPGVQPVISQNGQLLTSTTAASYQWMLNGTDIPLANSQTYQATVSGVYTVRIITGSGCSSVSDPVQVVIADIDELTQQSKLRIYPNPSHNSITIDAAGLDKNNATVEFFNTTGASVLKVQLADKIDVSHLMTGTYMVQVTGKQLYYKTIFVIQ